MDDGYMAVCRAAFRRSGWHGPLNRYRAQDADFAGRAPIVTHPSCFIAGTLDVSWAQVRGLDLWNGSPPPIGSDHVA
jgi:hypothetical protein